MHYSHGMSSVTAVAPSSFASLPFDEKLDRFARVAVHVGLNLQPGQELLITATTEMMPLVRRITEHAYKAGALLVTTFYADDEAALARYRFASDASFDHAPVWMADGIATAFRGGAARLALAGANPALLAGQDSAKVSRANIAASKANKPAMELITRHAINWSILAAATPAWAKLVFPALPESEAVPALWEAIFTASRATSDDPGRTPIYEYTWNHTTLHALRRDKTVTYLQSLFPADRQLELVAEVRAAFPDELLTHLEFIRVGGRVTCSGLPVIRYTTEAHLAEIVAFHESRGVSIANPHYYTLEDGAGHKRVGEAQPAMKADMDPLALLNPGKMRSYAPQSTGLLRMK